ncbi:amidase family protein [Zhihengliuella halotolerans]|uniref:amidase family protein n=1 Tax=Zhihengliuella halotolerans TaxID=370736 RepID=UPI001CA54030|nr:amidase family protein [Zhihengliuella halotolerans]
MNALKTTVQQALQEWRQTESGSVEDPWGRAVARARQAAEAAGVFISVSEQGPTGTGAASGELAGVPFAVKDNIDVRGLPTTAGSALFESNYPRHDASVVSILREAGARVVGKTNMHELALGTTSNNGRFGPVRNPADHSRTAGGSSGGSAAAVASGVVPFSLGTDTGASVTLPASFCGVVGFRPTTGRYPGDGLVGISWTRDTVGVHANSVEDVQLVDSVITREPRAQAATLPGRRVGVLVDRFDDLAPEVEAVARQALTRLGASGVELVDVSVADDYRLAGEGGMTAVLYEAALLIEEQYAAVHMDGPRTGLADLVSHVASPDVAGLLQHLAESPVSADQYEEARGLIWRLRQNYESTFKEAGVDALIAPTAVALPPELGHDVTFRHNGRDVPVFDTLIRNTNPGTSVGVPMISIPAGTADNGLPVGMLLEGPRFRDTELLSLAAAVEGAFMN